MEHGDVEGGEMDLKAMLPHRRSRADRARQRGLELAHSGAELAHNRKARAAAAGVAGAGAAAAAVVKVRRSHGNGQGPSVETPREQGHPAGSGFEPHT